MKKASQQAVSPVVGVIILVAVTVILSAVVGTFVLSLGEGLDEDSGQQVGVQATTDGYNVTYRVITGTADKLELRVNGSVVDSITDAQPGDTLSGQVSPESEITVLAITNGETKLASTANPLSKSTSSTTSGSSGPSAPTDGLIAHYTFDTGAGSTAYDSTGLSNNGSIESATWTTNAKQGSHALSFDGDASKTNRIVLNDTTINQNWTVAVWHNLANDSQEAQTLIDGPNWSLRFENDWGGGARYGLTEYTVIDAKSSIPTKFDVWTHVTYVGHSGQVDIYINGTYADTMAYAMPLERGYIGPKSTSFVNGWINGRLDDYRIYNRALNTTEISNLYNATK